MAKAAKTTTSVMDDPNAMYKIKLNARAQHGRDIMRPRDQHIVMGVAIADIHPQEAIESIEKVKVGR